MCGSVAEVEWLWSVCWYILTQHCSGLTPILFEAVVFLKVNQSYWDLETVKQAYSDVRVDTKKQCLKKDLEEDEANMEDDEDQ